MKTVAVIFGGRSAEHDVSIITAHIPIIDSLLASGQFDVWPVYIAKDGAWYADKAMNKLDFFKQDNFEQALKKFKRVTLSLSNGLAITWPGLRPKTVKIDVAFPAMHGTYGEDGTLMGLLRFADVPFVGCDIEASVIAMDKVLAKQVTEPLGIPSVPYIWFTAADWEQNDKALLSQALRKLEWPIFVKPVHLGSSIAITKANNEAELKNAIEVALHYDDKVIVERGVENLIEVTLPILGNDELELAHVEQPLATFFGFEEKYLQSGKKGSGGVNTQYSNIPAKISPQLMSKVQELGKQTYRAIGASGIARIDFLIDSKTNQLYMNEINTLPGSLYHHNWRQKGVSGIELVTKLINLAEQRFASQKKTNYIFRSEILKKAGGSKLGDRA